MSNTIKNLFFLHLEKSLVEFNERGNHHPPIADAKGDEYEETNNFYVFVNSNFNFSIWVKLWVKL